MTPDLFNCRPLNSVLSRSACGARYERRIGATCTTCRIGAQHARGALPSTWPDGAALTTAAVTIATMASLKVHLAVIASYERPPLRGLRVLGATIREHAERVGVHQQVIRQRLLRGETPERALDLSPRKHDPRQVGVRALARKVGAHHKSVARWLSRGLTPEQIVARCA